MIRDEQSGMGDTGGQQSSTQPNPGQAVFGAEPSSEGQSQQAASTGGQQGEDQSTGTQGSQAPAQPQQFTPELLKTLVGEAFSLAQQQGQAQQPQQTQQQQLSEADFNKFFGIPEVNEETYFQVFGLKPENPQQVKALNGLLQGVLKAAVKMATYQGQEQLRGLEQQYKPLAQTVREQQAKAEENQFFTKYPHLKDKEGDDSMRNLLLMIKSQAVQQGKKFNTLQEAHEFLARTADGILQKVRGTSGGQGGARPGGGQTGMPTTNLGGQSSHGRGRAPQTNLNDVQKRSHAVFG